MKLTYSTLLACVAALLFWLTIAGDPPRQAFAKSTDNSLRQSYLENAHRWRYDLQGERFESIRLSTANRLVDSPMTQLGALEYQGRDDKGKHWALIAGGGLLQENQDELRLNQGVEIIESDGGTADDEPFTCSFTRRARNNRRAGYSDDPRQHHHSARFRCRPQNRQSTIAAQCRDGV